MKVLDYEIIVKSIVPPMAGGKLKYAAKIQFLKVETEHGSVMNLDPGLSESYGESEDEARSKMEKKYRNWLIGQVPTNEAGNSTYEN